MILENGDFSKAVRLFLSRMLTNWNSIKKKIEMTCTLPVQYGKDLPYFFTYRGSQIVARRVQPDEKKKILKWWTYSRRLLY